MGLVMSIWLGHVIRFHCPDDVWSYLHQVCRRSHRNSVKHAGYGRLMFAIRLILWYIWRLQYIIVSFTQTAILRYTGHMVCLNTANHHKSLEINCKLLTNAKILLFLMCMRNNYSAVSRCPVLWVRKRLRVTDRDRVRVRVKLRGFCLLITMGVRGYVVWQYDTHRSVECLLLPVFGGAHQGVGCKHPQGGIKISCNTMIIAVSPGTTVGLRV